MFNKFKGLLACVVAFGTVAGATSASLAGSIKGIEGHWSHRGIDWYRAPMQVLTPSGGGGGGFGSGTQYPRVYAPCVGSWKSRTEFYLDRGGNPQVRSVPHWDNGC